jgi:hypothetical protein
VATKRYTTTLVDGSLIPVPFDPKAVFGKVRAPVKVTLNGFTYRSTIFSMGGVIGLPLRKSNREAAGLTGTETLEVTLESDTAPRSVAAPPDLLKALNTKAARIAWEALSFTLQREHVEAIIGAKKPETRARRIDAAVSMVTAKKRTKKTK